MSAHRSWFARALVACAILAAVTALLGWYLYRQSGRTPGELLDYADRRIDGHPVVETLAAPVMHLLRATFGAPSVADRARMGFVIPPPPPRRGASEIAPPERIPPRARVWRVSPDGPIRRIGEVARLARDGDVVEIEAGDYHQDVAVWEQARLTIRGVGGAARLLAGGRNAEGKAIWVIRNGDFDVANIDFIGARASDMNGAGIRFEGGRLRLRRCLFWNNQMGLVSSNDNPAPRSELIVEDSEFAYSYVDGQHWGHNLYVGSMRALTVTGSYFHHVGIGHLIKSRATINDIRYNRLTDEVGGRASYELEFPNGGVAQVIGNIIQQQIGTENSALVSFGAEGYKWPVNTLYIASNTLVNDHPHGGTFLRVAHGSGGVVSANNLLVGPGGYQVADRLTVVNDVRADWEDLRMPARQDYRLATTTARTAYQPLSDEFQGARLTPDAQYVHRHTTRRLTSAPAFVGALQDQPP
ncbi:MAG: hypothetical protein AW12_01083 [Candidatus Accumulibacter sp. BA-94]|uniref:hypothetical protein n=1 Tax=Accumulibacter sp. TaxID=2053492 RepID=UPI00044A3DDA|nr:hypothetical protein [Accumulibacter sp.]EXI91794.1 MAG: hypothetical protein AW12_01083 [Candidatus Accumulibacter sp. BA-94]MBL8390374.1 hypothetical protein [Accumulibacter sp.]HRD86727.1 hypothetical protein [Accumulibacter sp.]